MNRIVVCVAAASCIVVAEGRASATPRPLPFTYTTETLGKGELEFEQIADVTPVMAYEGTKPVWYGDTQFQTEFEYGITDRLELGLYVVYVPGVPEYTSQAEMTEVTGVKQRLRYVFADPGEWPIDVGVYGELVEGMTEAEFEGKVLLQRRLGKLRVDANLWAEYELYYDHPEKTVVLNPTLGLTYEVRPSVHPGLEGWARVEFPDPENHPRSWDEGPFGYVGPVVMFNFGKLWWSTGIYARVTDVNHTMQPGDPFGPLWGRVILGFEI